MAWWLKVIVTGALVVVVATVTAFWTGVRRQRRTLSAQTDRLILAGTMSGNPSPIKSIELDALPPPVSRYLRWAFRNERPTNIDEVRIRQVGRLRTDVRSERWMPFEAEHFVVPSAPGFVWNARVSVGPLLHVRVRDSLIDGKGAGRVSLFSAFTVDEDAETPEMNAGSLHRYLAEPVWYPTALLPGPALQWSAVDDGRALATLTDGDLSVSLEFRFAKTGEVTGIFTPSRWGKFPEGYRQAGWEGHFRDYREMDGIVVPAEGEVGWYVNGQWQAVWKGRVVEFDAHSGR